MIGPLDIPAAIVAQLTDHARRGAPLEACGILAGRGGVVRAFHPMRNADQSPDHFTMAPEDQFAVARAVRAAGDRMLAIFHSHPASEARPSAEDIRLALTPGVVHVILSLREAPPSLRGFRIEDGIVSEVPVRTVPDEGGGA